MSPTPLLPRRPRAAFGAAVLGILLLGGCYGGARDASHEGVSSHVSNLMVERGVDRSVADDVAKCVADEMFAGDEWSKDERNEANNQLTADLPAADLLDKLEALLTKYGALDGQTPVTDCAQADAGSTTTTEAQSSDGDDETTTTAG
jgi:hypothetical protein